MAATNPITSNDLTVDFSKLLTIPVSRRADMAAANESFASMLMKALTPIQMAKAFPDYYRRQLPDISGFILANRYLDDKGSGAFDQKGGGDVGATYDGYSGEGKVSGGSRPAGSDEPTVEKMNEELLDKGIDVDNLYNEVGEQGITETDPKVETLRGKSAEELASMGFEKFTDADGNTLIRQRPNKADTMTDEEVKASASIGAGKDSDYVFDPQRGKDSREKAAISRVQVQAQLMSEAKAQGIDLSPERAKIMAASIAGQANRESNYDPKAVHDNNTGLGMYGHRDDPRGNPNNPNDYRRTHALKWMEENKLDPNSMEAWNRYSAHEIMNLSRFKGLKNKLLSEDTTLEQATQSVADIFEAPAIQERLPGSDSMMRRHEGAQWALEDPKLAPGAKIITSSENMTADEIKQQREVIRQQDIKSTHDARVRDAYNRASPTSSDFSADTANGEVGAIKVGDYQTIATPADEWLLQRANFNNKEHKGAEQYNMSMMDYAIRGMDPRMRMNLYELGQKYEKETGKKFQINSAFRDDYRQSLAEGFHAETGKSRHGGSVSIGGNPEWGPMAAYGKGQAADLPAEIADWVSQQGAESGLVRSMPVKDPYHVTSIFAQNSKETSAFNITPDMIESTQGRYTNWMEEATKKQEEERQKREAEKQTVEAATPEEKAIADANQINVENIKQQSEDIISKTNDAAAEAPVEKFQFGGVPKTQDDEDLSVYDEQGKLRFNMNSGEGIYVKPEANQYADEKMDELSGKIDELSSNMNKPQAQQPTQSKMKPEYTANAPDQNWQMESTSVVKHSPQTRAFKRTQFRDEGYHVGGVGSPNSRIA